MIIDKKGTALKDIIKIIEGNNTSQMITDSIIDKASKNKILLHVIRAFNIQGPLRQSQELRMRRITEDVNILSKLLKGYDYAFFKLIKPVSYVPADVDVLINANQVGKTAKQIVGLGYRVAVKDPYCLTLTRGDSIVDLYVHPSLGGAIFIDGQKLLEHKSIKAYNGVEVNALESYAEALPVAAHAIYKEKIYTLNDYFTIKEWVSAKSFKLAEELICKHALKLALSLNEKIEKGFIDMPYKVPTPLWLALLFQKIHEDKVTRTTSINILKELLNQSSCKAMISKFTRESY
jgi:hypothetical protein